MRGPARGGTLHPVFLVLGAGRMGQALAWDLVRQPGTREVILADADPSALDRAKRAAASPRVSTARADASRPASLLPLLRRADATVSAEAMTLEDLDAGAVSELLDTLTPDQRAVVLLRVLGGFPVKDVARILGKRENAIKVLQHRAINALARTLERQGRNQVVLAGDGDTR